MIKSNVFNADLEESVLLVETTVRGGKVPPVDYLMNLIPTHQGRRKGSSTPFIPGASTGLGNRLATLPYLYYKIENRRLLETQPTAGLYCFICVLCSDSK